MDAAPSRIHRRAGRILGLLLVVAFVLTAVAIGQPREAHAFSPNPPDPRSVIAKAPTQAARAAIFWAYFQQGKAYTQDGNRRLGQRNDGFDCSGFIFRAYLAGRVWLAWGAYPWTGTLVNAPQLRRINSIFEMRPGDLIFWGNPQARDGHVGMFLDAGWMIDSSSSRGVSVRPVSQVRLPVYGVYRVIAP